jgi:hypothetical protein
LIQHYHHLHHLPLLHLRSPLQFYFKNLFPSSFVAKVDLLLPSVKLFFLLSILRLLFFLLDQYFLLNPVSFRF